MLKTTTALAVSLALLTGAAAAQESQPTTSPVVQAVKGMVKAVEDAGNAEKAARSQAARAAAEKQADEAAYPAVPAKYLRPDADPADKAKAVNELSKKVKADDKNAAE